jgi:ABC-2 type transport system permease protein
MLRAELTIQLIRVRTLTALAVLAAVPIFAAASLASAAGHRNGDQGGLFGASPYSALNHAVASLAFIAPLLLPIIVALLATATASACRDWGVLRYLYVAPVSRVRLLTAQLGAAAIATALAVACVVASGLLAGLAVFGWHPFHIIGAPDLTFASALGRSAVATGYTMICMLAMAAVAFTLGVVLPRGVEALGAAIAFLVCASILNAQPSGRAVAAILPVHYWQTWMSLFEPTGRAGLVTGAAVQVATIAVGAGVSVAVLRHRDPAA